MPQAPALEKVSMIHQLRSGIDKLNQRFWSPVVSIWFDGNGMDPRAYFERRQNPPWWPSANAAELLIDFMDRNGSSEFDADLASLYTVQKDARAKHTRTVAELRRRQLWRESDEVKLQQEAAEKKPGEKPQGYYTDFQNEYLDDSGWWGITWLKMYDRTREEKYLETAKTIHAHMANSWRPDKGGGVLWCEDEDKQRANAITNSLFLILAARLYERTNAPEYRHWAEKTLAWMKSVKLYDGIGVVDAPHHQGDYWSYNQGAYLGGLCALYRASGVPSHLEEAAKVAESVLGRAGLTTPDGTIVEKLGIRGDASLFKGIFVRYLAQLRDTLMKRQIHLETAAKIDHVIRSSAASILRSSTDSQELYPPDWRVSSDPGKPSFQSHLSALIALLGVVHSSR